MFYILVDKAKMFAKSDVNNSFCKFSEFKSDRRDY